MKLTCLAYRLPFKNPLKTSTRSYAEREGWILCWEESQEHFFAEAAPLPGFSNSGVEDITNYVHRYTEEWKKLLIQREPIQGFQKHYEAKNIPPALQFGLDSLAYQVAAHRASKNFYEFLFDNPTAQSVAVNGLVSLVDEESALSKVQHLVDQGFQTVKCKVGKHFQEEKEILFRIRKAFPQLQIRLDANQAWNLLDAIDHLQELEPLNIQYCEEPLSVLSPSTFQALSETTEIPLALDESINIKTSTSWEPLLPHASVLVVKPMVIGNLQALFDLKDRSKQTNCSLVFTSSLESSIGRGIVALLAAGMGTQRYAHGLNTGSLLVRDLIPNQPDIQNGHIRWDIHPQPVKADIQQLKEYSTSIIQSS